MSEAETDQDRAGHAAGTSGAVPARRPRIAAAVTAAVLFAGVATVLARTTPWNPLPGHVPGGHVRPDPALDFTPAEIARSRAFDSAVTPPAYSGLLVGLALILVLGLTPLGARFLGRATAKLRRRPFLIVLGTMALTTLLRVAGLPFDIWGESVLRRYGLSTQSWPAWLVDQAKSLAVTWVIYTIALLLLYALTRRFPRYWWTGAAAGGFVLVVFASFVYPLAVEPVFNKFHSLPAGQLRGDLLAMARRDGVPVKDVLVADASRRTTSLNAYVSGFGSTRRIVLYDTLLKSPPAQVESIVGHELGHAKRDDVLWGTLVGALGVAGAMCLLYLLMTSPRLLRGAGLDPGGPGAGGTGPDARRGGGAADPRSIALVLALVTAGTTLAAPVQNLVSRHIEARADAHALDLTRDPSTFVSMQHALSVRNISDLDPDTAEYVLWLTHPSAPDRIAMARDWARLHGVQAPPPLR
ncbi:STE24 endopeptidase [Actinomadura coerulea]|uniref:STE24 endopeptidase n=1 Tax=Actinomadura coerulea TaxID=46159 RepID=A0A7X0FTZ6_9ACTN|nr:M48 family metallopeptidase [Actinomadura coerulea]MBB6393657.1 STE24 endopeptidase [Actinomadura coerulea]GGP91273.1 Ste24 endopeptidase [Actinomadura coerulea]